LSSRLAAVKKKEEESQLVKKIRGIPVSFDSLPSQKFFSLEVAGEPDYGKTTLGADFPLDIVFLDTENKAYIAIDKLPEDQKGHVHWKKVQTFDDIRAGIEFALEKPEVRTVVIDSGSDLRDMAVEEWSTEHKGRRPIVIDQLTGHVSTILYSQVYDKIDSLIRQLHDKGKYLVVTSRLKDEYLEDERTGKRIPDSYKKLPWSVMIRIEIVRGILDQNGKMQFLDRFFGLVHKNNFQGVNKRTMQTYAKPILFDLTFEGICNELLPPWGPVKVGKEREQIIKEAGEWIAKNI